MALTLDKIVIAAFVIIGCVFVVVALFSSWLLSPKAPSREKESTYECGVPPVGPPWIQFRIGYYVYALLFVLFDIETVFLYPWAVAYRQITGWYIFVEMLVFVVILIGALFYAWKEGALEWR
ncbi:MAG: NADH-quinone oxidoreductase subunit A [Coriobacteriales bacterium]|nr:NADH-quinone oxidoreductase subunit A [Coriobacteriales bacterium]